MDGKQSHKPKVNKNAGTAKLISDQIVVFSVKEVIRNKDGLYLLLKEQ